jgi:hypothetical protein
MRSLPLLPLSVLLLGALFSTGSSWAEADEDEPAPTEFAKTDSSPSDEGQSPAPTEAAESVSGRSSGTRPAPP